MRHARYAAGALTAVVVVAAAGCGGPRVVKVQGRVTHQGEPVPGLVVNFEPAGGRPSYGRTGADGRFTLEYDDRQQGAVVGTHKVYLTDTPTPEEERSGKRQRHPKTRQFLERYGEASPLRVEVKSDGQDVPLELE